MKAMILAAGRGERMRPLTDDLPKPLICVRNKPLIVHHLEALSVAGVTEVIINIAYLGNKIRHSLGDGSRWKLKIHYSEEAVPLETGGAIVHALPLLGDEPFLLINADVFTDFNFAGLIERELKPDEKGCLVLVPNPKFKPSGDFSISGSGKLAVAKEAKTYTFSGISLLSPVLITSYPECREVFSLAEVFHYTLASQVLSTVVYRGVWSDVGTPERLMRLNH